MTEIEGYEDLELIGRGGFAVVYKAHQVSVGREVAIKLLSDPNPDADLVRRFQRESRAVGALSWHPHIAAVVDAGTTAKGQAYIVFELLSGGSLDDHITEGPLPWPRAVSSMIQIADAVEAAHRADVLHRDIKPANILLDRLGVAKLGDFGIASMQDGTKTATGTLATTVAHAAPELFDTRPASAATDVYALGSTLYNLLVGNPPFSPNGSEGITTTIGRILHEPPPRPDPALVPPQIADVIAHALAKQPEYRPRSAAEFGHALQRAQHELGMPVTAMPVADRADHTDHERSGAGSASNTATPSGRTGSASGHVPAPGSAAKQAQTFGPTIAVLSVIALMLAAIVGGALLFRATRDLPVIAVTAGGAKIHSIEAFAPTLLAGFPARNAIDGDETTYWGITPNTGTGNNIVGTTIVIKLAEEQTITAVGISNGDSTELGRVAAVDWATSIAELNVRAPSVFRQTIPDLPGHHVDDLRITTDQIVVAIAAVANPDAPNAGVAELVIDVE
jgi:serine/threonine protein kinase